MEAIVISGKQVAANTREDIKNATKEFISTTDVVPHLVVVLVGDNPASKSYIKGKQKGCEEVGMKSTLIKYPADISEEQLLLTIDELNKDESVHGILVQLPLPKHIDEDKVIDYINIKKDVDAFHPHNVGKLLIGQDGFLPCTPAGVIKMLKDTNITISGKHAVVIGRSNIVGKPLSLLLLRENATVTVCHSRTTDLKEITKQADILIAAVGRANFVTADMVKDGAVVIDVGVNRLDTGKLCGDVLFDDVKEKASYITPVPGGVGPMTITMLLDNTLKAAKIQTEV